MSESLAATNPSSYDSVPLTDDKVMPVTVEDASNNNDIETSEFTKEGYAALKKYVAEGDINIKTVGLVAAAGMTLTGFISCMAHLFMLDLFQAFLDAGTLLVGYVCSAMEYKESILWPPIADYVHTELHMAVTPHGRSIIYMIMGLILLTQDSWFQGFMGILIMCLGFFNYIDMKSKIENLSKMKIQLTNEGELRRCFEKYGLDDLGMVESRQIAKLCVDLGSGLTHDELVTALDVMDRSGNGKVLFDDFYVWYCRNKV